ncbi:MAG: hypothetical protein J7604_02605 [Sporocytophaga sp.]|uniref:PA14 domain-containing protein n=1 Tax=Sporocytophaga sp. TaxID=2231183 RepID=UPI001B2A06AC|nr:PA14 domain-containing protein [Sporocytophaga sp.]MBO9699069.1 hypothetical protein [Sporocytophaga sp.]
MKALRLVIILLLVLCTNLNAQNCNCGDLPVPSGWASVINVCDLSGDVNTVNSFRWAINEANNRSYSTYIRICTPGTITLGASEMIQITNNKVAIDGTPAGLQPDGTPAVFIKSSANATFSATTTSLTASSFTTTSRNVTTLIKITGANTSGSLIKGILLSNNGSRSNSQTNIYSVFISNNENITIDKCTFRNQSVYSYVSGSLPSALVLINSSNGLTFTNSSVGVSSITGRGMLTFDAINSNNLTVTGNTMGGTYQGIVFNGCNNVNYSQNTIFNVVGDVDTQHSLDPSNRLFYRHSLGPGATFVETPTIASSASQLWGTFASNVNRVEIYKFYPSNGYYYAGDATLNTSTMTWTYSQNLVPNTQYAAVAYSSSSSTSGTSAFSPTYLYSACNSNLPIPTGWKSAIDVCDLNGDENTVNSFRWALKQANSRSYSTYIRICTPGTITMGATETIKITNNKIAIDGTPAGLKADGSPAVFILSNAEESLSTTTSVLTDNSFITSQRSIYTLINISGANTNGSIIKGIHLSNNYRRNEDNLYYSLYVNSSNITIDNCTFRNQQSYLYGGESISSALILVKDGNGLVFTNNSIGVHSISGRGMFSLDVVNSNDLTLSGNTIGGTFQGIIFNGCSNVNYFKNNIYNVLGDVFSTGVANLNPVPSNRLFFRAVPPTGNTTIATPTISCGSSSLSGTFAANVTRVEIYKFYSSNGYFYAGDAVLNTSNNTWTYSGPLVCNTNYAALAYSSATGTSGMSAFSSSCPFQMLNPAPAFTAPTTTSYCANSASITLSATPGGGTFSGPGVSGTTFSPSSAGAGIYTLKYTVSGCVVEKQLTVDAIPDAADVTPLVEGTEPLNQTVSNLSALLKWKYNGSVPGTYIKNYIEVVPVLYNTDGSQTPDWVAVKRFTINNTTDKQTALSNFSLTQKEQAQTFFWRVALATSGSPETVLWSDLARFVLAPLDKGLPSASTFLASDGGGTNNKNINWGYEVSYLDEGRVTEVMSYRDGLNKERQVQTRLNSENKILCKEVAYSEEGGSVVNSLIAPTSSTNFEYAKSFFEASDGKDFSTEHFDRDTISEIQVTGNAITKLATGLYKPVPLNATCDVAKYYSNTNTDLSVDDAKGYPYAYSMGENEPEGRPWLDGGFGSTFQPGSKHETLHLYAKAGNTELKRIFGKKAVETDKTLQSISKSITIDANGVGNVTYTDLDGHVIATAMTACSASGLDTLNEKGTTNVEAFQNTYNVLENDKLTIENADKTSSASFLVTCDNTTVTLNYNFKLTSLPVGATECKQCQYDIQLKVVENATQKVCYDNTFSVGSTGVISCTSSVATPKLTDYQLTLARKGTYTVYRTIRPKVNASSGKTFLEEQVQSYIENLNTLSGTESARAAFKNTYYSKESWYLMRKARTNVNRGPAYLDSPCPNGVATALGYFDNQFTTPYPLNLVKSWAVRAADINTSNMNEVYFEIPGDAYYLQSIGYYNLSTGTKSVLAGLGNNVLDAFNTTIDAATLRVQGPNVVSDHIGDIKVSPYDNKIYFTVERQYDLNINNLTSDTTCLYMMEKNAAYPSGYSVTLIAKQFHYYSTISIKNANEIYLVGNTYKTYPNNINYLLKVYKVSKSGNTYSTTSFYSKEFESIGEFTGGMLDYGAYINFNESGTPVYFLTDGLNYRNGIWCKINTQTNIITKLPISPSAKNVSFDAENNALFGHNGCIYKCLKNGGSIVKIAGTTVGYSAGPITTAQLGSNILDIKQNGNEYLVISTLRVAVEDNRTYFTKITCSSAEDCKRKGSTATITLSNAVNNGEQLKFTQGPFPFINLEYTNKTGGQISSVDAASALVSKIINAPGNAGFKVSNLNSYGTATNVISITAPENQGDLNNGKALVLSSITGTGTNTLVSTSFANGYTPSGTCVSDYWYLDEAKVIDVNVGSVLMKNITQLDGIQTSARGDENYNVEGITEIGEAADAFKYNFVTIYNNLFWKDIKYLLNDPENNNLVSLKMYSINNAGGTSQIYSQVKTLMEDRSLQTPLQDFYLIKAKIASGGCKQDCYVKVGSDDCITICDEQFKALNTSAMTRYRDIENFQYFYTTIPNLGATSLKSLADGGYMQDLNVTNAMISEEASAAYKSNPYTLDPSTKDRLSGLNIYEAYASAAGARDLFNADLCKTNCAARKAGTNTGSLKCQNAAAVYQGCVTDNIDRIMDGHEYIMSKWSSSFPFALQNGVPNISDADKDQMGNILYNYLMTPTNNYSTFTTLSAKTKTEWNASVSSAGSTCASCKTPSVTSSDGALYCPVVNNAQDISVFPNILLPLLESSNVGCKDELQSSINKATGDYCAEIINECLKANTGDPSKCTQTYCAVYEDSLRNSLIRTAISEVYTDPAVRNTKFEEFKVANPTYVSVGSTRATKTLNELKELLDSYVVDQACLKRCEDTYEEAFMRWKNDQIINYKKQIMNDFYNNCFGKMDELFTATINENYYHYTLYNRNAAGEVYSTVPPDGVDIIKNSEWDSRLVPTHTQISNFNSNTLDQITSQSRPDEGLTVYVYDRVGRVRFIQSSVQAAQSGIGLQVFTYICYDDETGNIKHSGVATYGGSTGNSLVFKRTGTPATGTVYMSDFANTDAFPYGNSNAVLSEQLFFTYSKVPDIPQSYILAQPYVEGKLASICNENACYHFNYDIYGNVVSMVQELKNFNTSSSNELRYKYVTYKNLPISGLIKNIIYEPMSSKDTWYQYYTYDADSRMTLAEVGNQTGNVNAISYSYYTHGPLKRSILGDNIQGTDYVYNLQGWLKAINHPFKSKDPGKDGITSSCPDDIFAEVVNYYKNDFNRTGVGLDLTSSIAVPLQDANKNGSELFNGNVVSTVSKSSFSSMGSTANELLASRYYYDYLYRLKGSSTVSAANNESTFSSWTLSPDNKYKEALTYDPNGNIRTVSRYGADGNLMDKLVYRYTLENQSLPDDKSNRKVNNRLLYIDDNVSNGGDSPVAFEEMLDQSTGNYKYDDMGRLCKDLKSEIDTICWNHYNKVVRVKRTTGSTKPDLYFTYDPFGRRLTKTADYPGSTASDYKDIYTYDASGNQIASYRETFQSNGVDKTLTLSETYMYGNSRIGFYEQNLTYGQYTQQNSRLQNSWMVGASKGSESNLFGSVSSGIYQGLVTQNSLAIGENNSGVEKLRFYSSNNALNNCPIYSMKGTEKDSVQYQENGLLAKYFNNITATAPYSAMKLEPNPLLRGWNLESPVANVTYNQYSVEYTGYIDIPLSGSQVVFYTVADTGSTVDYSKYQETVKLFINDTQLTPTSVTKTDMMGGGTLFESEYEAQYTTSLAAGTYPIRIVYAFNGVNRLRYGNFSLLWKLGTAAKTLVPSTSLRPVLSKPCSFTTPKRGLTAYYYTGYTTTTVNPSNITTAPTLTRVEPQVNLNWGYNTLIPGASSKDNIAVRWIGKLYVPKTDQYTFYFKSDDGSRVYIDGTILTGLELWSFQNSERSQKMFLKEGFHDIEVQYYEGVGAAYARLSWSSSSITKQIIPFDNFFVQTPDLPVLAGNGMNLDPSSSIKANSYQPAVIAKGSASNERYYLVTASDGNIYQHGIDATDNNPMLTFRNQLLTVQGTPVSYSIDKSEVAMAVLNDFSSEGRNKLYLAVNKSTSINLYEFRITDNGITGGKLVYTFLDKICSSSTACTDQGSNAYLSLGEMQISPGGDKLIVSLIKGRAEASVGSSDLASTLEIFNISSGSAEAVLSYSASKLLNTELRDATNANRSIPGGRNLFLKKPFSMDCSSQGNYVYYLETNCTSISGCYVTNDLTQQGSTLKRINISSGIIETVATGFGGPLNSARIRLGYNNLLYVNAALRNGVEMKNSLLTYSNTEGVLSGIVEGTYSHIGGKNLGGLPLQPVRKLYAYNTSGPTLSAVNKANLKFEITDHIGNVRAVVSGKRNAQNKADVKHLTDYYAFGLPMADRAVTNTYKFGFQGMERDDANNNSSLSTGSTYNTEFRLYDPAVGRWLSIDPLARATQNPYNFVSNNPLAFNDPLGLKDNPTSSKTVGSDGQYKSGKTKGGKNKNNGSKKPGAGSATSSAKPNDSKSQAKQTDTKPKQVALPGTVKDKKLAVIDATRTVMLPTAKKGQEEDPDASFRPMLYAQEKSSQAGLVSDLTGNPTGGKMFGVAAKILDGAEGYYRLADFVNETDEKKREVKYYVARDKMILIGFDYASDLGLGEVKPFYEVGNAFFQTRAGKQMVASALLEAYAKLQAEINYRDFYGIDVPDVWRSNLAKYKSQVQLNPYFDDIRISNRKIFLPPIYQKME